ncbi:MAG: protein serine phosphatase with GAF(s) sensor(s) [Ilumatobacteraceae bacterium]|nr:protein serine phosphatase with GAF(s) sensor(s) [Ilumatobacteraceae bacterium]
MGEHPRSVSLDLQPSLIAPRVARSAIEDLLTESPDGFVADALLLTSELVTNAVLHTDAAFTVSAEFDPTVNLLRVEVADASTFVPSVPHQAADGSVGGHGLRLVAAIARRWGVLSTDRGKVIWFELSA